MSAVGQAKRIQAEGGLTGDGITREYQAVYLVETDSADDGPITARTAPGVPRRLDPFEWGNDIDTDALALAKRARLVNQEESKKVWEVTVDFSTDTDRDRDNDHPLDRPVRWSGSFVQFTKEFERDRDGNPIRNKAGSPITGVTGDDSRMSLIVEKVFPNVNLSTWAAYRDAVNNGVWWGLAAETIKVQAITLEQRRFGRDVYFDVRFEFHIDLNTWTLTLMNAGHEEIRNNKRVEIIFPSGGHPQAPVPLTTDGVAQFGPTVTPNFLDFPIYEAKDFSLLGLPSVLGADN